MFTEVSNVNKFNTRHSSHNYIVLSVKGTAAYTFFFEFTKIWNNLPKEIKDISNYMSFKRRVKLNLSEHPQKKTVISYSNSKCAKYNCVSCIC